MIIKDKKCTEFGSLHKKLTHYGPVTPDSTEALPRANVDLSCLSVSHSSEGIIIIKSGEYINQYIHVLDFKT